MVPGWIRIRGYVNFQCIIWWNNGGGSRIRTHGALACPTVFKTAAFGRSAIPPVLIIVNASRTNVNPLPPNEAAPPREAASEGSEKHQGLFPDRTVANSLIEGNGDRR